MDWSDGSSPALMIDKCLGKRIWPRETMDRPRFFPPDAADSADIQQAGGNTRVHVKTTDHLQLGQETIFCTLLEIFKQ